ncbi:MAG: 4Fe-4S binding protein [Proteobacteria bacterium]|nr:4Fe-4S binding protein [Pseudomonadota bacterium]
MKRLNLSKISQFFFLILFLFLFVNTEYRGKDEISLAINSFFRANPLVLFSYILSNFSFTWILFPALLLTFFSFFLGRFFCGWICPLGTTIDFFSKFFRKKEKRIFHPHLKYYLLGFLLFVSLFGINITGLLDPIAILVRFLTFTAFPLFGDIVKSGWVGLYEILGEKRDSIAFLYDFLKSNILPFRETIYPLAFVSFFIFIVILILEKFEKRSWCRNLCPLGTLLGLLSKFSIFKRLPQNLCKDCGDCKSICPTGFEKDLLQREECILCMDCEFKCKFKRVRFNIAMKPDIETSFSKRRVFITSFITGYFVSGVFKFFRDGHDSRLLRPPGVKDEKVFLQKCVRCGECIKICLKNALYPAVFTNGFYNLFTPILIPRKGYCEYNCTLCGQVCPTKAIPQLPLETKRKEVIGIAVFDKNHCLPYAKKVNCMVCEEHCPVPKKAIRFEVVYERDYDGKMKELKKPYVVDELCIGCGICEYICPLTSKAGIEVFKSKELSRSDIYGYNGNSKIS